MQISFSQSGANYALRKYYQNEFSAVSLEEYEEKYVAYVKKHIQITVDNKKIGLSSGGIKLGNHQTDMKFLLSDFPKEFENVQLDISVFKENENQNTVVKVIEGKKFIRKVLKKENEFQMKFVNTEAGFMPYEQGYSEQKYIFLILGIVGIFFALFFLRRRKIRQNASI